MNTAEKVKSRIDVERAQSLFTSLRSNVGKVIVGKDAQIRNILTSWVAGGHVLIEDLPGTGKTILVRTLSKSVNVQFRRVQFTPDLLPSDILGASIFNQKEHKFVFRPGPVFTTLLLADEINRATPRTQSALLEAMSEKQVTVEGQSFKLDKLFCTIATQNPVEQVGTFPLPEAQMDRFLIRMSMGYPSKKDEIALVKNQNHHHPLEDVKAVATSDDLSWLRDQLANVLITDDLYRYAVTLVESTRTIEQVKLGCSPRATIALCRLAQALALFEGYDYVKPQHFQEMAKSVMAHRMVLTAEARLSGITQEDVVDSVIQQIKVPIQK